VRELRQRTITAVVYGVIVLIAVVGPLPLMVLLALALLVGAELEVARLTKAGRWPNWPLRFWALIVFVGLGSLIVLKGLGPTAAHHEWADGLPVWLILAIVPTWAADIGAYVIGSKLGRRKIAPRISPAKTWEGTIAGVAAAALVAVGVGALFGLPRASVAVAAVALGPVAFLGDLAESALKRHAGVKDSGTMLPGHGGILDRVDSLLAVGPLVAILAIVTVMAERSGMMGP
jgi:phosphatidate cytidylyltransferase